MNQNHKISHTFVVCAYGKSPYLEECICSLENQRFKSEIMIATSTPNEKIEFLAEKYHLPLYINNGEKGLAGDWNFALALPNTTLITLAHQDDVYMPDYAYDIVNAYQKNRDALILFTDYQEIRNGETITNNQLLRVKRLLLFLLRWRVCQRSKFVRRRILSLGSAICCPSVTMAREKMPIPLFRNNMKSNIDWQAWEELSKKRGAFVYLPKPLMKHRIHADSTTSELLEHSARRKEDIYMFRKFWPSVIAELIEFFYIRNEKSNRLDGTDKG